jgi:hypothetical protein
VVVFARIRAGGIRGEEGVKAELGSVPPVGALPCGDVSQAVGINPAWRRLPQVARALVPGSAQPPPRARGLCGRC